MRVRHCAGLSCHPVPQRQRGCRRQSAALTPRIQTVASTGSTNADVIRFAAAGAGEGFWLRADVQTGGHGRLGRAWVSPPGNLYASTIVRVTPDDPETATLALVAALAVDETLGAYLPRSNRYIKWPNDVMIGDAKIAGILLERVDDAVVIGIGVNLMSCPQGLDRPVTSVAAQHAPAPDPALFLHDLVLCLAQWLIQWRNEGIVPVRRAWLARAHPVGTLLRIDHDQTGRFDGLDASGALLLRLADGRVRVIHAGDVFLI